MSAFRFAAAAFGLSVCVLSSGASAQTPQPSPDLVYSRVKPCRAFDTTKTQKIPAASARSFLIAGAGDYAGQGGTAAGCGVPASAQAVSLNITAINGAAAGSVSAMAYAQTVGAMTLRYAVSAPETAGGIVDLLQNKITLRTTNTVNAIGDVTGYWAPQLRALVEADGTLGAHTPGVISAARNGVGTYLVYFDRNVGQCAAFAQSRSSISTGVDVLNASYIYVFLRDLTTDGAGTNSFNVFVAC